MEATQARRQIVKNKLSIILPFLFGAALLVLSWAFTGWFLLGYAALGIGIGRAAYGKNLQPVIGDAIMACTGWLYSLLALFVCWSSPHNNKNLAQMMRGAVQVPDEDAEMDE